MGHDMSLGGLMVAARELAWETNDDLKVVVLNWLPIVINFLPDVREKVPMDVFDKLPKNKDGKIPTNALEGHGGAGETGRMLWQHSELVVTDQIRDYPSEDAAPAAPYISPIFRGGAVYTPARTTNDHPEFEGIFGYPSVATKEVGDGSYEAIANWVATAVETLCYRRKT
jgi:creatinine amidohydrolase/Fe(II)-dependent formamide hydrolase-like protein